MSVPHRLVDEEERSRAAPCGGAADFSQDIAAAHEALLQETAAREAAEAGEAAARRSEGKFRALLENAQDLTTIVDAEGGILYQTPSVRHVLGCAPDGLIGANWFDLIHPDDLPGARGRFARILDEGAAYVRGEVRLRHADGSWRLLENVASRTPAESPVAGLVINSRDVTERDRAQRESEARARQQAAIAELGARALQNPGLDEMFARASALAARALDVPLCAVGEAVRGGEGIRVRAPYGWAPADPTGAVIPAWRGRQAFNGETGHAPLIIADLRADPRFEAWPEALRAPRPVSAASVLIQADGRAFGTLCVLSAENPRAFSEQEMAFLQTMADLLSSAIERRRNEEALLAAKVEAERANNAKSEFLSRMSHELRTPLNAILGFGQLLEIEDLGPRHNQSVSHVLDAGRRLLDLVNEVLEISRLESGGIEPLACQPVDLGAALEEAARLLAPVAERRGVRFNALRLSCRLGALADPARLSQALLNLVDNAIKYNRPGGEVRFACRRLRDGRVRLAITDQGPGLSGADAARLFAPFERLDASRRGIGGIGAGLTVAKRLVEAMRGTIGVRSRLGRGSTFYLELPGDPAESGPAAAPVEIAAPDPARPPTVLHIEDEPANAALIERIFESRPALRLLTAYDGRAGLEMAGDSRPDLILLDLHLPDLPGEEVLRRLRENPRGAAAPVIVLSADALPAHVEALRQLGAHDYLTKPLDAGELLRVIDRLFPGFGAPPP